MVVWLVGGFQYGWQSSERHGLRSALTNMRNFDSFIRDRNHCDLPFNTAQFTVCMCSERHCLRGALSNAQFTV